MIQSREHDGVFFFHYKYLLLIIFLTHSFDNHFKRPVALNTPRAFSYSIALMLC